MLHKLMRNNLHRPITVFLFQLFEFKRCWSPWGRRDTPECPQLFEESRQVKLSLFHLWQSQKFRCQQTWSHSFWQMLCYSAKTHSTLMLTKKLQLLEGFVPKTPIRALPLTYPAGDFCPQSPRLPKPLLCPPTMETGRCLCWVHGGL